MRSNFSTASLPPSSTHDAQMFVDERYERSLSTFPTSSPSSAASPSSSSSSSSSSSFLCCCRQRTSCRKSCSLQYDRCTSSTYGIKACAVLLLLFCAFIAITGRGVTSILQAIFGVIFAIEGFWGAIKFDRPSIQRFLIYLCVECVLGVLFAILNLATLDQYCATASSSSSSSSSTDGTTDQTTCRTLAQLYAYILLALNVGLVPIMFFISSLFYLKLLSLQQVQLDHSLHARHNEREGGRGRGSGTGEQGRGRREQTMLSNERPERGAGERERERAQWADEALFAASSPSDARRLSDASKFHPRAAQAAEDRRKRDRHQTHEEEEAAGGAEEQEEDEQEGISSSLADVDDDDEVDAKHSAELQALQAAMMKDASFWSAGAASSLDTRRRVGDLESSFLNSFSRDHRKTPKRFERDSWRSRYREEKERDLEEEQKGYRVQRR